MILTDDEIQDIINEGIVKHSGLGVPEYRQAIDRDFAIAQNKKTLLSISKEAKRMDGSIYLVPDYEKYRQAVREIE